MLQANFKVWRVCDDGRKRWHNRIVVFEEPECSGSWSDFHIRRRSAAWAAFDASGIKCCDAELLYIEDAEPWRVATAC